MAQNTWAREALLVPWAPREKLEEDGTLLPPRLEAEIPVRGALVVPDSTLS